MVIEKTNQLNTFQKKEILKIWNHEYPNSLVHKTIKDFEAYLDGLGNLEHFVIKLDHQISGWLSTYIKDSKKWFVIIIKSEHQRKGIASQLIEMVTQHTTELYGWVIDTDNYVKQNGEKYKSPIKFYKKLGFKVTNDRLENKKISAVKIKWEVSV
ncbi:GNAT family N-acetyltransferase [Flavivirga spongiicola]|uniref:GNAT family N-acetyltransferase n=1 Tax=Flavivirga spongiicola TaxID=421621 RepID=A0ABU7XWS8_9FLAO|nr:GNAT family N-acetyltransferase [Flavivirga sp. MEBiC05379]MDO5980246.1 GNAT family N-acetyltransferase [Flavivirga sp. MEBiC05379]